MSGFTSDRIARSFIDAEVRSISPLCDDGQQAVAFNLADGSVVRLKLSADSVAWLKKDLGAAYRSSLAGSQSAAS